MISIFSTITMIMITIMRMRMIMRIIMTKVMVMDSPQVIHATVQLTLRNLGLDRMVNPSAAL